MIVEKAANMANMMQVDVVGLVENMSYIKCPDCDKIIKIFGESHIEDIAKKHGYPLLAKMPIDPTLAALVDAGRIEEMDANYLDGAVEALKIVRNIK